MTGIFVDVRKPLTGWERVELDQLDDDDWSSLVREQPRLAATRAAQLGAWVRAHCRGGDQVAPDATDRTEG